MASWLRSRLEPGWWKSARLVGTVMYCISFALLGVALASLGPILPDLTVQTGASLPDVSFIFSVRAVAYLIGSGVGGPLFDCLPGNRLVAVGLLLSGLGASFIPFGSQVWILAICVSVQGLAMGLLDTGGNVMLVWLHGDKVAPYMQLMHFAFGFGAFLIPLFIEASKNQTGDYNWAIWGMAISFLVVSIFMIFIDGPAPKGRNEGSSGQTGISRLEKKLVAVGAVILFLYVGCEVASGGFVKSYSLEAMGMSESEGNFLSSTFWGMLAFGRFVAIFISIKISPVKMLIINFVGCAVSALIILIFLQSQTALWIGMGSYGFFMGSIFPTVMNLVEEYVILSGKIAAVMVVCAALGEMAIPLCLSTMLRDPAIPWFSLILILEVCSVLCLLLLFLFLFLARNKPPVTRGGSPGFVPLQDIEASSTNLLGTPSANELGSSNPNGLKTAEDVEIRSDDEKGED